MKKSQINWIKKMKPIWDLKIQLSEKILENFKLSITVNLLRRQIQEIHDKLISLPNVTKSYMRNERKN